MSKVLTDNIIDDNVRIHRYKQRALIMRDNAMRV